MDNFKNFKGFGINGTYLSHSTKTPCEAGRDLLQSLRGKKIEVCYESISDSVNKYEPHLTFQPHKDYFVVGKQVENGYLSDVNTDNIMIRVENGTNPITYEIQRIVMGQHTITELRQHSS